jgi:hypothetical protein
VSPDFLACDFIHQHELGPLLKEAEQGGVKILWVPVRESAYKQTPLKNYQAVLDPGKTLAGMTRAKRDQAWVRICEEIERAVKKPHSDAPHVAGQDQAEDDVAKVRLFPNPALREPAVDFPPMQAPASFSLTRAKEQIQEMINHAHGAGGD